VWSKKRGLSAKVLACSNIDGGLGIGPLLIRSVLTTPPLKLQRDIEVPFIGSDWAASVQKTKFDKFGWTLPDAALDSIVRKNFSTALSTVDLPEYALDAQTAYHDQLQKTVVVDRQYLQLRPAFMNYVLSVCESFAACEHPMDLISLRAASTTKFFGKYRNVMEIVLARRVVQQYIEIGPIPIFDLKVSDVMKKFQCSRSVAEDWLLGSMPSTQYSVIHPTLIKSVEGHCAMLVENSLGYSQVKLTGLGEVVRFVSWSIGTALYSSKLHRRLYRW